MPPRKPKQDAPLGTHNGLPITARKIMVTNTGDGLSAAMTVVPVAVADGSEHFVSMRLRHSKTHYVNVFSKDDPEVLSGFEEVYQFRALGAVFDDRPDAAEQVLEMESRLEERAAAEALAEERRKREAKGEFTLESVPDEDESDPF